ncbi:MAG: hypothetical protein GYA17_03245, partial [Chloroflexi bacterium]|nr:hypothetical protein [Chloroflexota bacterium]
MKKSTAIVWMLLSLAWLAGCGQVQVSLEQTATPNLAATATLANLQAQNAVLETRVADQARREELESALTLDADSEMIRLRILDSYTLWNTVWADGDVTWYPPQGSADPPQEFHQQVWIDQESQRFRVISASPGDRPAFVNVSNGKAILQMDLLSGQTQSQNMPAYAQEEYRPPRTLSDTVYPHPLTGLMSSPLGEMLLPSGLAQRQGAIFLPVRMENVAGQQALVTDFRLEDGTRTDRFWIDTRTGVVLRWQSYTQGEDETLASDRQINQIQYDRQAPDELFSPQIGEPPQFALDYSGEPIPQQATPTPQPGQEAQTPQAGEFYFTINDLQ